MTIGFKDFVNQKGTYIGARFIDTTPIENLQKVLGLKNPLAPEKMHVTVLYSRNKLDAIELDESLVHEATGNEILTWKCQDGTDAVVLKMDSDSLSKRHDEWIKRGGTHDYPDYSAHVTLSYNDKIKPIKGLMIPLEVSNEYHEELDLDWKPNKDE